MRHKVKDAYRGHWTPEHETILVKAVKTYIAGIIEIFEIADEYNSQVPVDQKRSAGGLSSYIHTNWMMGNGNQWVAKKFGADGMEELASIRNQLKWQGKKQVKESKKAAVYEPSSHFVLPNVTVKDQLVLEALETRKAKRAEFVKAFEDASDSFEPVGRTNSYSRAAGSFTDVLDEWYEMKQKLTALEKTLQEKGK